MAKGGNGLGLILLAVGGLYIFSRTKVGKEAYQEVKKAVPEALKYFLNVEHEAFIKDLNPEVQNRFRQLIAAIVNKGYNVIVTSGQRSFAKQADLNKQDPKNAKPGLSLHNYGLAIDLNLQKGTKLWRKATSKPEWEATGIPQLAKSMGFRWGGDIPGYYDPVHFDLFYDTKQLLAKAIAKFGTDPKKVQGNTISLAGLMYRYNYKP